MTNQWKKALALLLTAAMAVSLLCTSAWAEGTALQSEEKFGTFSDSSEVGTDTVATSDTATSNTASNDATIKLAVKQSYTMAYQVLAKVNTQRKAAGLKSLKMEKKLLEAAMQRAAETAIKFDHTRPNGAMCWDVQSLFKGNLWGSYAGENIAVGYNTAAAVMKGWMNSKEHKANILNKNFTTMGVGCIMVNGQYCWSQEFGATTSKSFSKPANGMVKRTIALSNALINSQIEAYGTATLTTGKTSKLVVVVNNGVGYVPLDNSNFTFTSSKPKVCTVSKSGALRGVSPGTAKVTIAFRSNSNYGCVGTVTIKASLSKPKITSLKNKDGYKMTVRWSKNAKAKGYQIQYSTSSEFKGATTVKIKTYKTTKATIKNLTKGAQYYVRVRAYKSTSAGTYYSAWSVGESVTIQK